MTFATLRALHTIIGDALNDIERVYNSHGQPDNSEYPLYTEQTTVASESVSSSGTTATGHKTSLSNSHAYASPPPSPLVATSTYFEAPAITKIDFPSLDTPYDPTSVSEIMTAEPTVISAIGRIISAAGQLSATLQVPFLTICDATMGYHLPSCMRLLEASHVVEILREAGPQGMHVQDISERNGVDATKLAHILRLLATHHILREVSPDRFTLNRISSTIDSGKSFAEIQSFEAEGRPELKYKDTSGVSAFVGLCTDELQKSAAYMTETYYLSPSKSTRTGTDPARAPFCFAFDTVKTKTGFFGWLEGEITTKTKGMADKDAEIETSRGLFLPAVRGAPPVLHSRRSPTKPPTECNDEMEKINPNKFRLERFGKAMSGTDGWEAPGAVLNGFDWHSLPQGSIVVDVGGGIGSTSMLLAAAFSARDGDEGLGLKFIIQDRPVVCEMGEKAWIAQCPELLGATANFQVHDFFTPQPITNAAVFLLRVVLHDWPDDFARQILNRLRDAATPSTKLVLAEFVLPLACADDMNSLEDVEGAESILAPAPLLPNLGKASANVYWMDMTMQTVFNAQERTLREIVTLSASAGWKVIKVSRTAGSLFGYMVAIPAERPVTEPTVFKESDPSARAAPVDPHSEVEVPVNLSEAPLREEKKYRSDLEVIERASSRCGTPTFGSRLRLSSVQEALTRFGGGVARARNAISRSSSTPTGRLPPPPPLKPALSLSSGSSLLKKKAKPSPLSVPPAHISPGGMLRTPVSANGPDSSSPGGSRMGLSTHPRDVQPSPRASVAHAHSSSQPDVVVQPPKSPASRLFPRRLSLANLRSSPSQSSSRTPPPPLPKVTLTQQSPLNTQTIPLSPTLPRMKRRASHAQIPSSLHKSPSISSLAPTFIPIRSNTLPEGDSQPSSLGGVLSLAASPNITTRKRLDSGSSPTATSRSPAPSIQGAVSPRQPTSIPRRSSNAQLSTTTHWRKRSGTIVGLQQSTSNFVHASTEIPSSFQPNTSGPTTPSSFTSRSYFSSISSRSQSRAASPSNVTGSDGNQQTSPASYVGEKPLGPSSPSRTSSPDSKGRSLQDVGEFRPEFETGTVLSAAARFETGDI